MLGHRILKSGPDGPASGESDAAAERHADYHRPDFGLVGVNRVDYFSDERFGCNCPFRSDDVGDQILD